MTKRHVTLASAAQHNPIDVVAHAIVEVHSLNGVWPTEGEILVGLLDEGLPATEGNLEAVKAAIAAHPR